MKTTLIVLLTKVLVSLVIPLCAVAALYVLVGSTWMLFGAARAKRLRLYLTQPVNSWRTWGAAFGWGIVGIAVMVALLLLAGEVYQLVTIHRPWLPH